MNISYEIRSEQWSTERIIKEKFYITDFYKEHTRKSMREILIVLMPHITADNSFAFRGMTKKRMIKHIECYIHLHNIKCDQK